MAAKAFLIVFLIAVFLAAVVVSTYWYRDRQAKREYRKEMMEKEHELETRDKLVDIAEEETKLEDEKE